MDLGKFLRLLPQGTYIRVKVAGYCDTFAGKTGARKTDEFLHNVYLKTKPDPFIYAIYPLYHAMELYIECW